MTVDEADIEGNGHVLPNKPRPPRQRLYHDGSNGPWVVYFRPKPNGKRLNLISIARDLRSGYPSISQIERVSPNKMRVIVGSLKEANAIASCEKFTIEYRVYIPARDVECYGKVTEESLTASELMKNGVGRFKDLGLSPIPIVEVYQLPAASGLSNTWKITFVGTALPDYVTIGALRLPVKLFVPRVMNCLNCFRLGHTATYCENKARCNKCGEHHDSTTCGAQSDVQKCLYCGSPPHLKLSDCPKIKLRSEKIKSALKVSSQKSYREILTNSFPSGLGNRFALLSEDETDTDDCCEGTSSAPLKSPPRKRKATPKNKPNGVAKIKNNIPQSERYAAITKKSPPGNKPDPLEYPPLKSPNPQGTFQFKAKLSNDTIKSAKPSKDPAVGNQPASGTDKDLHLPSDEGKFKLSDILDMFFDFLDFPDSWKRIVKLFLPKISAILKQKVSSYPFIVEFISFDE